MSEKNTVIEQEKKYTTVDDVSKSIAPFWRRIGAFAIDSAILGLVGFLMGSVVGGYFWDKELLGRCVGLVIAISYFGYLNSRYHKGQTIGKQLLKIKVVDSEGADVGIVKSGFRFLLLAPPIIFNGITLPMSKTSGIIIGVIGGALFAVVISNLYLLIFNRKSKQFIHDVFVKTFVVMEEAGGSTVEVKSNRINVFVSTAIFVGVLSLAVFYGAGNSETELGDVYKQISALPEVYSVVTSEGTSTFKKLNGETNRTKYYTAVVKVSTKSVMNKEFADKIGEIVKADERIMAENQMVKVVLKGGYSLGIWNSKKHESFIVK